MGMVKTILLKSKLLKIIFLSNYIKYFKILKINNYYLLYYFYRLANLIYYCHPLKIKINK